MKPCFLLHHISNKILRLRIHTDLYIFVVLHLNVFELFILILYSDQIFRNIQNASIHKIYIHILYIHACMIGKYDLFHNEFSVLKWKC